MVIATAVSDNTRDREFYKYFLPPLRSAASINGDSADHVPKSSHDPTLTALAQLGCLRINTKRAMISMFNSKHQFILAEATRTLSLQSDKIHDPDDALRWGQAVLHRGNGPCEHTFVLADKIPTTDQEEDTTEPVHFMSKDLSADERFTYQAYPINESRMRFFCGVPIRSPRGINIGAYVVIDDKPRDLIDNTLINFMTDVAKTITQHLETSRFMASRRRGERMVRGLGSFVDGRATTREGVAGSNSEQQEGTRGVDEEEGLLHANLQNTESERHMNESRENRSLAKPTDIPRTATPANTSPKPSMSAPRRSSSNDFATKSVLDGPPKHTVIVDDMDRMLSRATNIVREALEVEGAVLLDASASTFGSLLDNSNVSSNPSTSRSESARSDSSDHSIASVSTNYGRRDDDDLCGILGFSTTHTSSISQDSPPEALLAMKQSAMKSLLRRHPSGKIFHFNDEGSYTSTDASGGSDGNGGNSTAQSSDRPASAMSRRRTKISKGRTALQAQGSAEAIAALCPGCRSVAIMPLRNAGYDAWFAGLIIWTKSPHRIFTSNEDLSFLAAFGNSIMAEAERLTATKREQAKSDLISSISHEFRSPLQGILGSLEILSEIPNVTGLQSNMLYTIETCGRTLRDVVDHLLDYAKINSFEKTKKDKRIAKNSKLRSVNAVRVSDNAALRNLTSAVDIGLLTEEVIEAVYAGQERSRTPMDDHTKVTSHQSMRRVNVIIDIQQVHDAFFMTTAGAWRRIVMNLIGNALKYTNSGFIAVALRVESTPGDKKHIRLTVNDSGKGISPAFLSKRAFSAFSQEDTLSPGTGLGLSMVKKIVTAFHGQVNIESELNSHTLVTVTVPMTYTATPSDVVDQLTLTSLTERVSGLTVCLVGFDAAIKEENSSTMQSRSSTEALRVFQKALQHLCGEALQMKIVYSPSLDDLGEATKVADLFIVHHMMTMSYHIDGRDIRQEKNTALSGVSSPIIFLCETLTNAVSLDIAFSKSFRAVEYIALPCGPRKLVRALTAALDRHGDLVEESTSPRAGLSRLATIDENDSDSSKFHPVSPAVISGMERRLGTTSPPSLVPTQTTSSLSDGKARLLLVDDNSINLRLLETFAKKNKFASGSATNGLEAFELFKISPLTFRIILMDISMPIMNGLESTRSIRAHESAIHALEPAMIICLTGVGSEAVQKEAFASGVDLFLTKPVRFGELLSVIKSSVYGKRFVDVDVDEDET